MFPYCLNLLVIRQNSPVSTAGIDAYGESNHADGKTDTRTDGEIKRRKDGQTDTTKLIVVFCNFSNAPNNHSEEFALENPLNVSKKEAPPPKKREREETYSRTQKRILDITFGQGNGNFEG